MNAARIAPGRMTEAEAAGRTARARAAEDGTSGADPIEVVQPLSPLQQGILYHCVDRPEAGQYYSQLTCRLVGDLDLAAFEAGWRTLAERHPALRTAFVWEGVDVPVQVVLRRPGLRVSVEDLLDLDPPARQARLHEAQAKDRAQGFRLTRAPLIRLRLFRLDPREHLLLCSYHHLIVDGWSEAILFDEFSRLYASHAAGGRASLAAAPPFGRFLAWLGRQDLARAERFWRSTLAGSEAPTPLGEDGSAAGATRRPEALDLDLPAALTGSLRRVARANQLTLNTVVLGAWGVMLGRLSGRDDVVTGLAVSGRPPELPGVEAIVGPFVNTLPVRVRLPGEARLLPWLRDLQEQVAETRRYEYTPLVEIQRWAGLSPGAPLFDSIFVFQNGPALDRDSGAPASGLQLAGLGFRGGTTSFPVSLEVTPRNRLNLALTFDRNRFTTAWSQAVLSGLAALLSELVRRPEATLEELRAAAEPAEQRARAESRGALESLSQSKLKTARRRAAAGGPETEGR